MHEGRMMYRLHNLQLPLYRHFYALFRRSTFWPMLADLDCHELLGINLWLNGRRNSIHSLPKDIIFVNPILLLRCLTCCQNDFTECPLSENLQGSPSPPLLVVASMSVKIFVSCFFNAWKRTCRV